MKKLNNCNKSIALFKKFFNELSQTNNHNIAEFYDENLVLLEDAIWRTGANAADIKSYQNIFLEFERHLNPQQDNRHHILLVIPVADRPQHLQACLDSIYTLCECYGYGGKGEYYNKVSVLIAEDSKDIACREKNKEIADLFSQRGLASYYFGLDEQQELLARLNETQHIALQQMLGSAKPDFFYHKGASITRNITYLKLMQLRKDYNKVLFYFIDSDQEFKINQLTPNGEKTGFAINYFYYLDKLFSENDIEVLTGKVVGDPPVSPSVMASNFITDICTFILKMSQHKADESCCFHSHEEGNVTNDAAYHDMANLFGFKDKHRSFDYHCNIEGKHDNADCFIAFASKLNQFFDGVHLTRKTYYQHERVTASVSPARTIYTGNYVFTVDALKYFIPFASLKLRMAGPTMGRLLKEHIGTRFVSANLPMLHGRIIEKHDQSEFRSGIQHTVDKVCLAGEFERQFFGDVMLFSIEKLTEKGCFSDSAANSELSRSLVREIVLATEVFIRKLYSNKITEINTNLGILIEMHSKDNGWWFNNVSCIDANKNIERFVDNININFSEGSFAFKLVNSDNTKTKQIQSIIDSIMNYKKDMSAWNELLKS